MLQTDHWKDRRSRVALHCEYGRYLLPVIEQFSLLSLRPFCWPSLKTQVIRVSLKCEARIAQITSSPLVVFCYRRLQYCVEREYLFNNDTTFTSSISAHNTATLAKIVTNLKKRFSGLLISVLRSRFFLSGLNRCF